MRQNLDMQQLHYNSSYDVCSVKLKFHSSIFRVGGVVSKDKLTPTNLTWVPRFKLLVCKTRAGSLVRNYTMTRLQRTTTPIMPFARKTVVWSSDACAVQTTVVSCLYIVITARKVVVIRPFELVVAVTLLKYKKPNISKKAKTLLFSLLQVPNLKFRF